MNNNNLQAEKMTTYLEAYGLRLDANNQHLITLAQQLIKKGFEVIVFKDKKKLNALNIYDAEGKGVRLQFNEVPYRWSLEYDINPSAGNGSSYTGKEFNADDRDHLNVTIQDIEANLKTMYKDTRFASMYTDFKTWAENNA